MDEDRLRQALATVEYMRAHRSTAGASDPVVYDLLYILLKDGFGIEINSSEAAQGADKEQEGEFGPSTDSTASQQ